MANQSLSFDELLNATPEELAKIEADNKAAADALQRDRERSNHLNNLSRSLGVVVAYFDRDGGPQPKGAIVRTDTGEFVEMLPAHLI